MTRSLATAALLMLIGGGAVAQVGQSFGRIERGRYLTVLGDCGGCHTAPGGQPFAGGLALDTPFGKIVASNITPDRETGIGNWSDAEFLSALHDGRGRNGTRLYPAMPYPAYTKMSDDDVLAIRTYLGTVTPVHQTVQSNQLPFPFNIRLAMAFWNELNFIPGRSRPNPQKSAEWNRGAYLVTGAAHCGACHTPKNLLGGDRSDTPLAGATLQGWYAPNLTGDARKGIGGWTRDELAQYLKTGSNGWTLASGPMAEAVTHSTSLMQDDDIAAIATYLKDDARTSAAKPAPVAASSEVMRAGASIYKDNCSACHQDSGAGEPHLFPRLAGSAMVQSDDPTTLIRMVLHGSRAVATATRPTAPAMPAFDWRLGDAQVAAVVTFIRNSWGNAALAVPASGVGSQRLSLARAP